MVYKGTTMIANTTAEPISSVGKLEVRGNVNNAVVSNSGGGIAAKGFVITGSVDSSESGFLGARL